MNKFILMILACFNLLAFGLTPHFMKDPAISPNGEKVCFSYDSDLWIVPFKGGEAKRLTSTTGENYNPVFSLDGKTIAFNSDRDGIEAVYTIPSSGGEVKKISDMSLNLIAWMNNDKALLVKRYEQGVGNKLLKLDFSGKRPLDLGVICGDFIDISKDNKKVVFSKNGYYEREAYKGSKNGELWSYDFDLKKYKKLTNTDLTERYPVYSYVNGDIYFSYSDGKIYQIYMVKDGDSFDKRKSVSDFKIWSARDLSIAHENNRIVYEYFDNIGAYDPATQKTSIIPIEIKEDLYKRTIINNKVFSKADKFAVSPNGKWIAFVYKYDLFAVPSMGGEVKQITHNQAGIGDVLIANDNETIIFTSRNKTGLKMFKVNIKNIENLEMIKWSKNKDIVDIRKNNNSVIIKYDKGEHRGKIAIADSICLGIKEFKSDKYIASNFILTKNKRYAFYADLVPENYMRTLFVYDFDKKQEFVLGVYRAYIANLMLGDREQSLIFNKDNSIYKFDLSAKEDFPEKGNKWAKIFKKNESKEKKDMKKLDKDSDVTVKYDNPEIRIKNVVSKIGWNYPICIKNDSLLYYVNNLNGKETFRKIDFEGKDDLQIADLGENVVDFKYHKITNMIFAINNGSILKTQLDTWDAKNIDYNFRYTYDKVLLKKSAFDEMWFSYGKEFYDKKMHGIDWDKMYDRYKKYMNYYRNPSDFQTICSEMIGEVNASHSEFNAKDEYSNPNIDIASIGCVFDYTKRPNEGLLLSRVYRKSPLYQVYGIRKNDILLSINDIKITDKIAPIDLLKNKTGEKLKLKIKSSSGEIKTISIKGVSNSTNYDWKYDNWVFERKNIVDSLSNNQIGYLHIRNMDMRSYNKFMHDIANLNIKKKAIIIDVRNNGGGNTHDIIMNELIKKAYGYRSNRDFNSKKISVPSDAIEKPLLLMINRNSASDAEIFPAVFRESKLGKILGTPTSGYVIGTYEKKLIDGSHMRLPSNGWYYKNGINMEGNGVEPDIFVDQSFEEILRDDDVQLKKSVEILMKEIK